MRETLVDQPQDRQHGAGLARGVCSRLTQGVTRMDPGLLSLPAAVSNGAYDAMTPMTLQLPMSQSGREWTREGYACVKRVQAGRASGGLTNGGKKQNNIVVDH
eukprot:365698-Chlamydomonas_euryale.AAC.10